MGSRASENFWGRLAQYPPKNLGQIPAALAISGIFEWFSPGQNGSEVWRQITLNSLTGPPTSGPFGPGENRSKMPEIARAAGIWPKFFGGYWARHPQKFSLALLDSSVEMKNKIPLMMLLLPGEYLQHSHTVLHKMNELCQNDSAGCKSGIGSFLMTPLDP